MSSEPKPFTRSAVNVPVTTILHLPVPQHLGDVIRPGLPVPLARLRASSARGYCGRWERGAGRFKLRDNRAADDPIPLLDPDPPRARARISEYVCPLGQTLDSGCFPARRLRSPVELFQVVLPPEQWSHPPSYEATPRSVHDLG